ncbi:MFS transporter [Amycolatopsis japonica]|uniref:MFS transporter n=1 Tax=Amycolatopsis japonica TaxID=208439 RepID=UPI0033FC1893
MQDQTVTPAAPAGRAAIRVTLLCWIIVVIEGYDIVAFGTVVPVLLANPENGFTPENIGWIGSAVFVGAMVGALSSGALSDRYGRRPVAIGAVTIFTLFTVLCGTVGSVWPLALFRLLAGLGIGAIMPAASALTLEYAIPRYRTLTYTLMLSGVPVGGVFAAVTALPVIPAWGWEAMFLLAGAPGVICLFITARYLPESPQFLDAIGRRDHAAAIRARFGLDAPALEVVTREKTEGIFGRSYRAASIVFAAATFCGLFAWYGLATWLPGLMSKAGYALDSSLVFLLVLNLGAVTGSLVIAAASDRWSNRPVVVLTYLGMAAALMALSIKLPSLPLLVCIAVAGVGGHGGQILINAFVSASYPTGRRARALGWSLGAGRTGTIVGPIVIGWLVSGRDPLTGFAVFAGLAVVAAILLALCPRTPAFRSHDG